MPGATLQRAILLVNADARSGRDQFGAAKERLGSASLDLVRAELITSEGALDLAIAGAIQEGIPLVIVGGGDGTLRLAAKRLVNANVVLGVLPMGTGNAFARDLGIPTDLEQACEIIESGSPTRVDVGELGGEPFLSVATLGVSTLVAGGLGSSAKRRWGPLAYLAPIARAFRRSKPFRARIVAEGIDESFPCLQLVVGNGRFHAGPFKLPEGAGLQSGRLAVYAIATCEKLALYRYAWELVRGRIESMQESRVYSIVSGRIETVPLKMVTVDGERLGWTPVDVSVSPGAMLVMAASPIPGGA